VIPPHEGHVAVAACDGSMVPSHGLLGLGAPRGDAHPRAGPARDVGEPRVFTGQVVGISKEGRPVPLLDRDRLAEAHCTASALRWTASALGFQPTLSVSSAGLS
jgi:hypothetical protein